MDSIMKNCHSMGSTLLVTHLLSRNITYYTTYFLELQSLKKWFLFHKAAFYLDFV